MTNKPSPYRFPKSKPIDLRMNKLLLNLVTTQKGWLVRQLMKGAAAAGTVITTWLVAHGVTLSQPEAITAALATLGVGVLEMALSKAASYFDAK